jgi:inositol-1,3,4-trisphosphate 5/6-kinase/inositol-tetrakisphosphate 1-kinase
MSLIFGTSGLKTISPPCVAQTFINHNARLFKLFLIKDQYFVIERPSLKNFKRGDTDCEPVFFDSHDISKPTSCCALTELDRKDQTFETRDPEKARLDRIVKVVSNKLGLTLLGIDVIIDNKTGRYAIIDMNAFPGYDGVDSFLQILCDITVEEIHKKRKGMPMTAQMSETNEISATTDTSDTQDVTCLPLQSVVASDAESTTQSKPPVIVTPSEDKCTTKTSNGGTIDKTVHQSLPQNGTEFDSGIDTSDSCDENKYKKQSVVKVVRRQHSRSFTLQTTSRTDDFNSI